MTDIFSDILGRTRGLNRPAVLGPESCSHGELLSDVEQFVQAMAQHGIQPRSPIALALPHGRRNIVAILALHRLDAIIVAVNYRATASERAYIISNAGATHLIAPWSDASQAGLPLRSLQQFDGATLFQTPETKGPELQGDDAVIIHTSGSTARPKGVVLTREAISANTVAVSNSLDLTDRDCCALFTPPSFAYAFSQILTHLWVGGALLPWPHGLLNVAGLLHAIDQHAVSGVQANPTMFEMLLSVETATWPAISSVRYLMSGGQPLYSSLVRRLEARFANARIASMYGLTENAPRVAFRWLPKPVPNRETAWPVGKAVAGTRVRIRNETADASVGSTGEIEVSGTSLMRGYLHEAQDAPSRFSDGWFKTRDSGFIDDNGDLNLIGRLDNIFSVGHEKVSPEEIEDLLSQLAGIGEVAVSHVPHALLGAVPVVLFTATANTADLIADIRAACTRSLSRAKFPRHIFRVKAIPRTPYGKIDRRAVKALAVAQAAEAEATGPR